MRLLSLTLRNYRIHRELTVEFDPSRNLIGGPNEAGKSTLAEAIHRALFFRHRSGGEAQRAMKSNLHPGHPEVQLVFEAGGRTWTLDKRFSGANGTARLGGSDGSVFNGDAAEDEIARIVGNPHGAVTTPNQLAAQWAHLWVWQGTAGDDASSHAASRRDELVQRLQQTGLAAVMQSATDEQARGKARLGNDEFFTRTGAVKAGCALDLARRSRADAAAALAGAEGQKSRMESAIIDQESAAKALAESLTALPGKRDELAAVEASLAEAKALSAREEKEELLLQSDASARKQLADADRQIHILGKQATAAKESLIPAEEKLSLLSAQEASAREASATAEAAYRAIAEGVRLARQRHDLAAAWVARFEKSSTRETLAAKSQEVAALNEELATQRAALAKLPLVTAAQLEALRKSESQHIQADSALAAIAAGVELVSSDEVVCLNGAMLEAGKPQVITEISDFTVGTTHLRISPGGGTSLAEARRKAEDLRKKFAANLDGLAVHDPAAAAEIVSKRQAIEQEICNHGSRLQAMGARELPEALAAASAALASAETELDRRRAAVPAEQAPPAPATLAAGTAQQSETRAALQEAEQLEQTRQVDADTRRSAYQEKLQALQAQRESLEAGRRKLANLETSGHLLEGIHGDAAARAAALEVATAAESAAAAALAATASALAALSPELLAQSAARLSRVIDIEVEKQREARTRIAVSRSILALDGSSDPDADLLHAQARHASASDHLARAQRDADAAALLHRLFSESQSAISASVTQPIADRVAGYLECLFGRGVRVVVNLADPAHASIQLIRPSTPAFNFESLSGGAKEQVAAAVRLATAEILAASHDGTLPVLFDDAFAYADDDRIEALQSMLDLAATRGLQILVLSCTPAGYRGFGAKDIRLTPQRWSAQPAAVIPAVEDATDLPPAAVPPPAFLSSEAAFLAALRGHGGSAGNQTLRSSLAWSEPDYDQVKSSLLASGQITPGRGRSVALVQG